MTLKDPVQASQRIRVEESKRLNEIRQIVLATTNNVPIRIGDIVEGGADQEHADGQQGIVVGNVTPQGRVSVSVPRNDHQSPLPMRPSAAPVGRPSRCGSRCGVVTQR